MTRDRPLAAACGTVLTISGGPAKLIRWRAQVSPSPSKSRLLIDFIAAA